MRYPARSPSGSWSAPTPTTGPAAGRRPPPGCWRVRRETARAPAPLASAARAYGRRCACAGGERAAPADDQDVLLALPWRQQAVALQMLDAPGHQRAERAAAAHRDVDL